MNTERQAETEKAGSPLTRADVELLCREAGRSVIDLSSQNLQGIDLSYMDLRGANLSGAHLQGAYLRGINLREADLTGADLSYAHLGNEANRSDLSNTKLSYATLRGLDLHGFDLSWLDLQIGTRRAFEWMEKRAPGRDQTAGVRWGRVDTCTGEAGASTKA